MLCPDVAYDSAAPATGEIYKGLLQLEKLYHAGTGGASALCSGVLRENKAHRHGRTGLLFGRRAVPHAEGRKWPDALDSLNALAAACGELEGGGGKELGQHRAIHS